jgi:hypothetical protein
VPDLAGRAGAAAVEELPVEDQPGADPLGQLEVRHVVVAPPRAPDVLGESTEVGVVLDHHVPADGTGDELVDVEPLPVGQQGGSSEFPGATVDGRRKAGADGDDGVPVGVRLGQHLVDELPGMGHHAVRVVADIEGHATGRQDGVREIGHGGGDVAVPEVDADRDAAGPGQADDPAPPARHVGAHEHVFVDELPDDVRHRRGRQPAAPRDLGLGQLAVHQQEVEEALLIGTLQGRLRAGRSTDGLDRDMAAIIRGRPVGTSRRRAVADVSRDCATLSPLELYDRRTTRWPHSSTRLLIPGSAGSSTRRPTPRDWTI